MSKDIRHVIGVVTYVNDDIGKERKIKVRESLPTLQKLKREDNFIFIWDNSNCEEHRDFLLKNCSFADKIYFSTKNLFDVGPLVCIDKIATMFNAEFVSYIEDDMTLHDETGIIASRDFLRENPDCGYVRLIKFDFENKHLYDKQNISNNSDIPHMQRHFNFITKEKLSWESAGIFFDWKFYKNNWHWHLYPSVCRHSAFNKIVNREDTFPMMESEHKMMIKYNSLNLKTGILDKGCFTHNQPDFASHHSARVKNNNQKLILADDVHNEIEKFFESYSK